MIEFKPPPYTFLIDTDTYAGGFERELCAYMTGVVGDCGVGSSVAEVARKELQALDLDIEGLEDGRIWVLQVPDDHGCHRPVSIEDAGRGYKSVGIYFDSRPSPKLIALLKQRALAFERGGGFKILGFRLLKRTLREKEESL